jgi:hypothetical protein
MSTQTNITHSDTFTTGWIVLLFTSVLATLNHLMLPAYGDDIGLAIGWTGYSAYAIVILAIPFRRGERWAWYSIWILVLGFAAPMLFIRGEGIAIVYLIIAGVMAVCLLLTQSAFFQKGT